MNEANARCRSEAKPELLNQPAFAGGRLVAPGVSPG